MYLGRNAETQQQPSPSINVGPMQGPADASAGGWDLKEQPRTVQEQMQGMISAPDPSNIYRSKLEQMSTGQFAPSDPSYQFRLQQGQQALERSQAARGMAGGGGAAIELQQYGQQAASQEYGAQFQRMLQGMLGVEQQYQTQFSRLAELAGVDFQSRGLHLQAQQQTFGQAQISSRDIGIGAGLEEMQKQTYNPFSDPWFSQPHGAYAYQ